MRILLTSGASYAPPRGGSTRSNLVWLRHLSEQGNACRVVCPAVSHADTATVQVGSITIRRMADLPLNASVLCEEIRAFEPDWVLVSSEDVSQMLLREADRAAPGRVIYLAHTPQFFPFGPESWNRDAEATRIVQRAAGVVAIGTHMAAYIEKHAGVQAQVIHPPIYGDAVDAKQLSGGKLALMINPCAVKGIEIFIALAQRCPDIPFGALQGWGTTSADRAALARLPNVRLLENAPDISDILSQARLLLMPSIWYEGFGLIVMEAMLRGLPVIASDSGGLLEAKEGTGFVIPVKPIERYEMTFDENHMPRPVCPPQDIGPWEQALRTLYGNEPAYEAEAARARTAALRFVSGLRADGLEQYLLSRPAPDARALLVRKLRQQRSR
ncbi:MAG: glycosyltransferase family 4 protein [Candidatus Eremiobacteraeota bacterium]|nr:glycosyltransferase family 4 protein [Candidatus Eremiobacteraeota bacterium]